MMGRFIDGIAQCQQSCRETRTYENFPEDFKARDLLLFNKENLLMDPEVSNAAVRFVPGFNKPTRCKRNGWP